MAPLIIVGISDCRCSSDRHAVLVTYALGSCIAVAAYDPVVNLGGLLHIMLPESSMDTERGRSNPSMYGDTGVAFLLDELCRRGATRKRLAVYLAGGAQVLDDGGLFNIGKRNHISVRKALWKAGLFVKGESIGGTVSRSVWLEVDTGRFLVREGNQPMQELGFSHSTGGLQQPCASY